MHTFQRLGIGAFSQDLVGDIIKLVETGSVEHRILAPFSSCAESSWPESFQFLPKVVRPSPHFSLVETLSLFAIQGEYVMDFLELYGEDLSQPNIN